LSRNRDNPTETSQGGPHPATPTPRVVVDTNVCLDLFLFRDPHAALLHADLQTGAVVAVTNAECRGEWLRVLQYPQLQLDDVARATLVSAFDALIQCLPDTAAAATHLPRCADPDDQKFLQLASDCAARWLVSRDDAVLALARRTRRDGLFEIVAPRDWSFPAGEMPRRAIRHPAL
jgi:putative PIN family toxin of toxin-antitoxin system